MLKQIVRKPLLFRLYALGDLSKQKFWLKLSHCIMILTHSHPIGSIKYYLRDPIHAYTLHSVHGTVQSAHCAVHIATLCACMCDHDHSNQYMHAMCVAQCIVRIALCTFALVTMVVIAH